MRLTKRRWSDRDHHLWPFTWAFESYRKWGVMLDSGEEESRGCHIRFYFGSFTLLMELPPILWPQRTKVMARSWDAATVARLGRDWYWHEHPRELGFSLVDGSVHFHYGAITMDSSTDHVKVWRVPWLNWRFVRMSYYDLAGEHWWTEPKGGNWQETHEKAEKCPSIAFGFHDFDGEHITATTHIEEREWRFGIDWCSWLSRFCQPKIQRSLDIDFSKETGPKKGSWKGGTVGHSISMLPGELHEAAFRRYCAEHSMVPGQ